MDVHDKRLVTESYGCHQVQVKQYSFTGKSSVVVLSNHVIKQVGNECAQRALAELHRAMRHDGIGYLAGSKLWLLVEPHYRLVFLSWLPHSWRSSYLRMMRKGTLYDCEPLQLGDLENLFKAAGFKYRNLCIDALRVKFEIEWQNSFFARLLRSTPEKAQVPLKRIILTLIYRFWL
jgi:hypothetical protein